MHNDSAFLEHRLTAGAKLNCSFLDFSRESFSPKHQWDMRS